MVWWTLKKQRAHANVLTWKTLQEIKQKNLLWWVPHHSMSNKIKINNRVTVSTAKTSYLMASLKIQKEKKGRKKFEKGHKPVKCNRMCVMLKNICFCGETTQADVYRVCHLWKCVSWQMHVKSSYCVFYGAFNVWNYLSGNRSWSFMLNQSEMYVSHQEHGQ